MKSVDFSERDFLRFQHHFVNYSITAIYFHNGYNTYVLPVLFFLPSLPSVILCILYQSRAKGFHLALVCLQPAQASADILLPMI